MKVKQSVIDKINNPTTRTRIALAMGIGENAVSTQIRLNNPGGRLTKMDALEAISKETGMAITEILEDAVKEVQD